MVTTALNEPDQPWAQVPRNNILPLRHGAQMYNSHIEDNPPTLNNNITVFNATNNFIFAVSKLDKVAFSLHNSGAIVQKYEVQASVTHKSDFTTLEEDDWFILVAEVDISVGKSAGALLSNISGITYIRLRFRGASSAAGIPIKTRFAGE